MRLEVLKAGKDPEVIVARAGICVPSVSLNGELMAIRIFAPEKGKQEGKENRIIIVNKQGEVVAILQVPN